MLKVNNRKTRKEKEERIMEVALDTFREKGVEKTSIRNIMRRTEFGLGTFYLYFKDKKDLEEKIVLDMIFDLIYEADKQCEGDNPTEKYICFISYIIDHLVDDPIELDLILKNTSWALYSKVENDERFKEDDTALKFILNKYLSLFPVELSESEQLFAVSLTMHIVLSTCKAYLMEDSVLSIEEMKSVLFKIVEKIFSREDL
jgi:AcrR family transcriptional regulator